MQKGFLHLSHGVAINIKKITHIDFRKPDVSISLGANSVTAKGDDAAKLREMFEPTPEERAAEVKERAAKREARTAAINQPGPHSPAPLGIDPASRSAAENRAEADARYAEGKGMQPEKTAAQLAEGQSNLKTDAQNKAASDNREADGEVALNTHPVKAAADKRKAIDETNAAR